MQCVCLHIYYKQLQFLYDEIKQADTVAYNRTTLFECPVHCAESQGVAWLTHVILIQMLYSFQLCNSYWLTQVGGAYLTDGASATQFSQN